MIHYVKYGTYVLRHKWFVFRECMKAGIPFRGITHDLSKFLPSEFFPYARFFYTSGGQNHTSKTAFDFAWLLHQKRNRHHWQWWMLPEDEGGIKLLEMPDKYRKEMVCDWKGAGKALGHGDDTVKWYGENKEKIQLHPRTRRAVEEQLGLR